MNESAIWRVLGIGAVMAVLLVVLYLGAVTVMAGVAQITPLLHATQLASGSGG